MILTLSVQRCKYHFHAQRYFVTLCVMNTQQLPAGLDRAVAEELRALMARRRITVASVAKDLGWGQMYLSRRLNGQVPFSVGELIGLARSLKVPVTSLLPADTISTWSSLLQDAAA